MILMWVCCAFFSFYFVMAVCSERTVIPLTYSELAMSSQGVSCLFWLFGQEHKNSGICAWLHCCTPMRLFSYSCLSAAFLCGVFYSTWTTQKVCTNMDLLNLVNSQLCVDVVMYFWGRKGNTKGTLSFSKTLIRNGLPFLLQSCKISSLFGALCEFPYSSLPSLLTTNLKLADSWRADSELFWPCLL